MCTTGAIVLNDYHGNKRVFGFKTSDSPWTGFWHGQVNQREGFDALSYGLIPQQGINAGMNQLGMTVISSYFDFESHQSLLKETPIDNPYWGGDIRGIVQGEVLASCQDADEAKKLFIELFKEKSASVGGNHIILDEAGNIYVFEHCRGQKGLQIATDQGYVARSNQSLLLFKEEQKKQDLDVRLDRGLRLEQAEYILASLKKNEEFVGEEEVLHNLKKLTSMHVENGNGLGSICAHGITKGRSNSVEPHETMSALIWDVTNKRMHYTIGHPCKAEWRVMEFT